MSSNQVEKKFLDDQKVFGDLPPRVIVHEILSHHLLSPSNSKEQNQHFGYFKRDRSRHIWFIFSRAEIGARTYKVAENYSHDILDYGRIVFLAAHVGESDISSQLQTVSRKMTSLRRLESMSFIMNNSRNTLFSAENCFPNLDSISLLGMDILSHSFEVHLTTNVFRRIQILKIRSPKVRTSPTKENLTVVFSDLTKLKSISLSNIAFPKSFGMKLPNIKKINLCYVENLSIHRRNERINVLKLSPPETELRMFKDLYQRSRNVKVLRLQYLHTSEETSLDPNLLIFNPECNPLSFLRKLTVYGLRSFSGLPNSSFGENIEFLRIQYCADFPELLLHNREYKKLSRISFCTALEPTQKWTILNNVKRLEMTGVIMSSQNSSSFLDIFKLNEDALSKNLEELVFEYFRDQHCRLDDEFFERMIILERLRRLEFKNCCAVVGSGVKKEKMNSLEYLRVEDCHKFDEEGFRERLSNVNLEFIKNNSWF